MVSGPLCNRASSATKSVRHSPVLAILCSASRLRARELFAITSQSRGAVMTPLFFIMCSRSGGLRSHLAPDAVLRRGRQEAIDGSCTCSANHQKDRNRQRQKVELKAFSLLRPRPVHKEAELVMDHCDRYEHVAKDSKRGNAGKQAEDETQSPEKFRGNGQKCERGRDVHHAGEEAHCAGESVSTEPSEHLLGAVSEEDNPQHQSKNRCGSVVVRRYEFTSHRVLSWELDC